MATEKTPANSTFWIGLNGQPHTRMRRDPNLAAAHPETAKPGRPWMGLDGRLHTLMPPDPNRAAVRPTYGKRVVSIIQAEHDLLPEERVKPFNAGGPKIPELRAAFDRTGRTSSGGLLVTEGSIQTTTGEADRLAAMDGVSSRLPIKQEVYDRTPDRLALPAGFMLSQKSAAPLPQVIEIPSEKNSDVRRFRLGVADTLSFLAVPEKVEIAANSVDKLEQVFVDGKVTTNKVDHGIVKGKLIATAAGHIEITDDGDGTVQELGSGILEGGSLAIKELSGRLEAQGSEHLEAYLIVHTIQEGGMVELAGNTIAVVDNGRVTVSGEKNKLNGRFVEPGEYLVNEREFSLLNQNPSVVEKDTPVLPVKSPKEKAKLWAAAGVCLTLLGGLVAGGIGISELRKKSDKIANQAGASSSLISDGSKAEVIKPKREVAEPEQAWIKSVGTEIVVDKGEWLWDLVQEEHRDAFGTKATRYETALFALVSAQIGKIANPEPGRFTIASYYTMGELKKAMTDPDPEGKNKLKSLIGQLMDNVPAGATIEDVMDKKNPQFQEKREILTQIEAELTATL